MNPYLVKIAKSVRKEDSQHHDEVLKRLEKEDGVVAQHSMGSGKTLLALKAAYRAQQKSPDKDVIVSAPASVVSQFPEEAKKFNIKLDEKRIQYFSHEELSRKAKKLAKGDYSLMIVDEGHRLRNTSTAKNKAHSEVRNNAEKALILSGTGMYNKPHDIGALVNLAAGDKVMPDSEGEFEKKFIHTERVDPGLFRRLLGAEPGEQRSLANKGELRSKLRKYVHNYDAQEEMPEEFANKNEKVHQVDMAKDQYQYYRFAENQIPFHIRLKIRHGLPLSKKESSSLNAFSSAVRQISNTHASYTKDPEKVSLSPKFEKMLEHSDKARKEVGKDYRGVVYSNYLGSGLEHYSRALKAKGIKHEIYHGGLSKTEKDRIKDDFNAGKFDTLLLSSSGAEGLNLKGVRHVQIMEPHWNKSKIEQVIARGVRRGSHAHLKEKDRQVQVDHYHSVLPKGFLGGKNGTSIEEYLHDMSHEKEDLKKEVNKLIA